MYKNDLFAELTEKFSAFPASVRSSRVWLVLEGDFGGQIYLTVPWRRVGERARIALALGFLDLLAWPHNDGMGARAFLHPASAGPLVGGMGGGSLRLVPWFHPDFTFPERAIVLARLDLYPL